MKSRERVVHQEVVYRGRVFDIRRDTVRLASGEQREFSIVQHPGAVVIIPQLSDGKFLLVRQWRRAVNRELIEFPAGTLEEGEEILACAKRELIEETSHEGAEWIPLGELLPVPGYANETQHCFLARNLTEKPGNLDEDEIIEVQTYSKDEVLALARSGEFCDAKSLAIFLRAMSMGLI